MKEVYSTKELAAALGVPWQTVVAWKRNNQIPSAAITDDGKFLKEIIDPFIEWYKNDPTADTSMSEKSVSRKNTSQQLFDMAPNRKKIPKEVRNEALRLLNEEKLSVAAVAEKLGCSRVSVSRWQRKSLDSTATQKPKATLTAVANSPMEPQAKPTSPEIRYDDFMRSFWQEGSRAVDVLLLPPEIGTRVINYVNDALKYAYETLR